MVFPAHVCTIISTPKLIEVNFSLTEFALNDIGITWADEFTTSADHTCGIRSMVVDKASANVVCSCSAFPYSSTLTRANSTDRTSSNKTTT